MKSLPKNRRKITIQQAAAALAAKGCTLGLPTTRLHEGRFLTEYPVTLPTGETKTYSAAAVAELAYSL